jgi:hypothetical protein
VKGPGAVLEIQASGISVEAVREREEFYGEMAWMLKGGDFAKRLNCWYEGQGLYELIWKTPRKTWAASERRLLVDLDGEVLELLQIRQPDVTPWSIKARFLSADDIYKLVLSEEWELPQCGREWYEEFSALHSRRKRYEATLDGMNKFIENWRNYPYHIRQDFAEYSDMPLPPKWTEWSHIYHSWRAHEEVWNNLDAYAQKVELWLRYLDQIEDYLVERDRLERERIGIQCAAQKEEAERRRLQREKEEAERSTRDLAFRREQEAAARISAEKARQLALARQREEEARARAIAAAKRSAELLQQASLLVQEAGRGDLCDKIIALRPVSVQRLGKFSTVELSDLLQSFTAARDRLGADTWKQLVEAHRA